NGLKGIHFVAHSVFGQEVPKLLAAGYDAVNMLRLYHIRDEKMVSLADKLYHKLNSKHYNIFPYRDAMEFFTGPEDHLAQCYPTLIPNWDHSPRSGSKAYILTDANPKLFGNHIRTTRSEERRVGKECR